MGRLEGDGSPFVGVQVTRKMSGLDWWFGFGFEPIVVVHVFWTLYASQKEKAQHWGGMRLEKSGFLFVSAHPKSDPTFSDRPKIFDFKYLVVEP